MRPFALASFCALLAACRPGDDIPVVPSPPELVVIDLQGTGCELVFRLPDDAWRRDADRSFKGFRFREGARTLEVQIRLRREDFAALSEEPSTDAVTRSVEPGSGWPFVGVLVAYRGPPDPEMLEDFTRSFRVERR